MGLCCKRWLGESKLKLVRTMRGRRSNWHIWVRDFSTGQVETLCGYVLTKFKRGEEDEQQKYRFMGLIHLTCINCHAKRELLEGEIP